MLSAPLPALAKAPRRTSAPTPEAFDINSSPAPTASQTDAVPIPTASTPTDVETQNVPALKETQPVGSPSQAIPVPSATSTMSPAPLSPGAHWLELTMISLGSLFMPLICLAYLAFRLPGRKMQLANLFKSDGILKKYLQARVRLPAQEKGESDDDYRKKLVGVFDGIFSVELGQEYGLRLYALPMLLSWVLTSFAACYLTSEALGRPFVLGQPTAVYYGIFGAFVWSFWNLLGRYSVTNLSPSMLWWIPFRYLVAIAYGLLALLVFNQTFANLGAFVLAQISITDAFGFFRSRLSAFGVGDGKEPESGFQHVQGLDNDTVEILADLGIVNSQQLANSDPLKLLMKSNFTPNVLIDWMDQCFLFNYVGEKIALLRPVGIRGAIELASVQDYDAAKRTAVINALAQRLATTDAETITLITNCYLDNQLQLLWGLWGST
jgi:hypothetical protein